MGGYKDRSEQSEQLKSGRQPHENGRCHGVTQSMQAQSMTAEKQEKPTKNAGQQGNLEQREEEIAMKQTAAEKERGQVFMARKEEQKHSWTHLQQTLVD